jgi:hypothetical protein
MARWPDSEKFAQLAGAEIRVEGRKEKPHNQMFFQFELKNHFR